jgi:hypothetical protein
MTQVGMKEKVAILDAPLARITSLPMTAEYPVLINRPKEIDSSTLRPGMSGTATVFAPDSKPLDTIGWLLLYGRALALYL